MTRSSLALTTARLFERHDQLRRLCVLQLQHSNRIRKEVIDKGEEAHILVVAAAQPDSQDAGTIGDRSYQGASPSIRTIVPCLFTWRMRDRLPVDLTKEDQEGWKRSKAIPHQTQSRQLTMNDRLVIQRSSLDVRGACLHVTTHISAAVAKSRNQSKSPKEHSHV